jgi:hypothetical protein
MVNGPSVLPSVRAPINPALVVWTRERLNVGWVARVMERPDDILPLNVHTPCHHRNRSFV